MSGRGYAAVGLLVALGLSCPLPVTEAQQAAKVYRIGVLFEGTPIADMAGSEPRSRILREFLDGLRELGYAEGQNVTIERRSAEGKPERLPGLGAELVRLNVDVILSSGERTTPAVLAATSTIPIVQPTLMDPVERGYAKSLARPGQNITGLSVRVDSAIYGKLLDLLKEAAPDISRVAVLHGAPPVASPSSTLLGAMAHAAMRLRVTLLPVVVEGEDQFVPAFAAIGRERADALIVEENGPNTLHRQRIVQFAAKSRLPAASGFRSFTEDGGLMSYGTDDQQRFRRAATYVDRILKGAKPSDLPIEQPAKFAVVVNLKPPGRSA